MKPVTALVFLGLLGACEVASVSETTPGSINSLLQCPDQDICSLASVCCIPGVDSYGWIAAAVGWSLWFLTLILYCVGKVMNLHPNEPKYQPA
ncbi:transmembrane protein 213 [Xenopus laevis]|uniref:Transmembrane protein 213 n=1 Tax=Xenopus laevis TaxID=8355 RepID=A0A8J0TWM9_XENLA|nr:transmembrane protein 213 [Xenopus laevis]OCT58175.1 hypothetical protein XELAEV_18002504mg [Xenopus laevis]